jgi:hypothetical protein
VLPAAFAATQDPVPIAQPAYDAVYGERFSETAVGFGDATITFTPAGAAAPLTLPVQSRGLQELFDTSYGRANATLGVELPTSQIGMLTAVPFYYSDPATEIVQGSPRSGAPQAGDGTQVWKITHNGVDTHTIDLGRFDAQIVNRVGWDGAVTAADAGELGWNRVVRLEPLQAVILAVRPIVPELPFKLANSTRLLDPTRPRGSTLGFSGIDPLTGNAIDLRNQTADFGWEYTWQSGLLERQDNDMRRPLVFAVAPRRVPALAARRRAAGDVMLTWEATPTGPAATRFILQRARDRFFTEELEVFPVAAAARRFTDTGAAANQTSYYRLRAENDVAYSAWSRIATVEAR